MITLPDIRQIRIFIALEETRSFTGAAQEVHVTQSAVSHSIKSLERLLDCSLIERMGKKIALTPQGEVFLHHAKRCISELESSILKLETLKRWGYSMIRLGASDAVCQYFLPASLKAFSALHEKCELMLTPADTPELLDDLKKGELDIAVGIYSSMNEVDHRFIPLVDDELVLVAHPDHPAVKQGKTPDLSNTRLLLYSEKSATTKLFNDYLSQRGIVPRHSLNLGNLNAIIEMTRLQLGVGVVPSWFLNAFEDNSNLVTIPIFSPAPKRTWGVYTNKGKTLSLPEETLVTVLREQINAICNFDQTPPNVSSLKQAASN